MLVLSNLPTRELANQLYKVAFCSTFCFKFYQIAKKIVIPLDVATSLPNETKTATNLDFMHSPPIPLDISSYDNFCQPTLQWLLHGMLH